MPFLLICDCGDCKHWEILVESIVCKSCGKEFSVPGLRATINAHTDIHPELSWSEHSA